MLIWDFERLKKIAQFLAISENVAVCKDIQMVNEFQFFHGHTFYEITYVFTGKGVLYTGANSYVMEEGFLCLTLPGESHMYTSTSNLQIANICFAPNSFQKSLIDKLSSHYFSLSAPLITEYELLFALLENAIKHSLQEFKINSYLNAILNNLFDTQFIRENQSNIWTKLLSHINNHPNITVQEAAAFCSFSVGHFCRSFHKNFSCTFTQYLDLLHLSKAKELLITTKLNIDDISSLSGFSHPTRFHRLFKENEGMTPAQYRKTFCPPPQSHRK